MANQGNAVLYIGVTSHLSGRVQQHKRKEVPGFTQKYCATKLVYYEEFRYVYDALAREKQLKNWHRQWKINQITEYNPEWLDLAGDWY